MDYQRTILLVALAVVGYLLILQWQEDYGNPAQQEHTYSNTQSYPQSNSSVSSIDDATEGLPSDSPADDISGEDVPSVAVSPTDVPARQGTSAKTSAQNHIEIKTDVLKVSINRSGGDIVGVELLDYPVSIEKKNIPIKLLEENRNHLYIAQSGLIGPSAPYTINKKRPLYQSGKNRYTLGNRETLNVPLTFTQSNGTVITKTYTFRKSDYAIAMDISVDNLSPKPWVGSFFAQIKRDDNPDPGLSSSGFGLPTYLGAAYWDKEKPYNKIDFEDMREHPLKKKIQGGWVAMVQHYFMSAWIPQQDNNYNYSTRVVRDDYIIGFTSAKSIRVEPGTNYRFGSTFYAGPKIQSSLEALLPDKGLDLVVDYGPLFFLSKLLFIVLNFFHDIVNNWGVAIILLTLTVKICFFPLSAKSYRSMANMRRVQPEMTRLREQYGDDRQRLSQEMMKLYRTEKINPLGGCLPILIQMPVFLALYWALLESVELRQAPFLWIQDLSLMDPYFVLPLLMGATMWIQQSLNPAPPDPMQARMMKLMPIIFTVFFLWFPAGLVLYWVTNNALSIHQQWLINRSIEKGAKNT